MKYLFAILLPLLISGCVLDYVPNSRPSPGVYLYDMIWTADGDHILVESDSVSSTGNLFYSIRDFDKDGTLLHIYPQTSYYYLRNIWPTADDSTVFIANSSNGNYSVYRYFLASERSTAIAGGTIYGQSSDNKHLFIGPYSSYQSEYNNNLLIVDVSGSQPRLQKSWYDPVPQYTNGLWIGKSNIGYLRYNSFNLIDFLITDSNGTKLDSFDISGISNQYSIQTFYGQNALYLSGHDGIIKYDSTTKASTTLTNFDISAIDISSDGSFIVYNKNRGEPPWLTILNTKTGATKSLDYSGNHLKISPNGSHLAYTNGIKLFVIPVSAP